MTEYALWRSAALFLASRAGIWVVQSPAKTLLPLGRVVRWCAYQGLVGLGKGLDPVRSGSGPLNHLHYPRGYLLLFLDSPLSSTTLLTSLFPSYSTLFLLRNVRNLSTITSSFSSFFISCHTLSRYYSASSFLLSFFVFLFNVFSLFSHSFFLLPLLP